MLAQAMDSIARVRMDPVDKGELTAKIMERALATVQAKGPNRRLTIGGMPGATTRTLRDGLEATYRTLASSGRRRPGTPCPGGQGQRGPPLDPDVIDTYLMDLDRRDPGTTDPKCESEQA